MRRSPRPARQKPAIAKIPHFFAAFGAHDQRGLALGLGDLGTKEKVDKDRQLVASPELSV